MIDIQPAARTSSWGITSLIFKAELCWLFQVRLMLKYNCQARTFWNTSGHKKESKFSKSMRITRRQSQKIFKESIDVWTYTAKIRCSGLGYSARVMRKYEGLKILKYKQESSTSRNIPEGSGVVHIWRYSRRMKSCWGLEIFSKNLQDSSNVGTFREDQRVKGLEVFGIN